MRLILALAIGLGFAQFGFAAGSYAPGDYLIQMQDTSLRALPQIRSEFPEGTKFESLNLNGWVHVQIPQTSRTQISLDQVSEIRGIRSAQPNYTLRILENPTLAKLRADVAKRQLRAEDDCPFDNELLCAIFGGIGGGGGGGGGASLKDNQPIPAPKNPVVGATDPKVSSQWGMNDIGAPNIWNQNKGIGEHQVIVAVIDTGIDYNHEDLVENLWHNPGEYGTDASGKDKSSNGIDDDKNGYVDDLIGWDFPQNDNKPYDLSVSGFELMFGGGNPGHGTHCAGNVGARGFNGKGISGVSPNVRIMGLRFITEKGQGTTADAVKSIMYAIKNGAKIMSNSWGSEGEDVNDPDNKTLRDAIRASQDAGVLFVAAAGNGHQGKGYDNDNDPKPAYPASYNDDIIVSVAALDSSNNLGSFSNWGRNSVDIGAPGVKVFSTTVGSKYSDVVANMGGQVVTWDGTSMATPHVAGAAAMYLTKYPNANWKQIKNALLSSASPIPTMAGKSVSGGKLNMERLMSTPPAAY